jgi:hypothetical protein
MIEYLKNIKKILKKLMLNKKYNEKNNLLFEIYINIYLIIIKKRDIAQVTVEIKDTKAITKILNENYPYYKFYKNTILVLYNPTYKINNLNTTFTKKYGKQLGNFYKCSGNHKKMYKKYKFLVRPKIKIFYKNIFEFELFAQMCPVPLFIKNINFFIKLTNKYKSILQKIDKNIFVGFYIDSWYQ